MLLFISFLTVGCLDWTIRQDPCSPGMLLTVGMCLVLVAVMCIIFQACIKINDLLERDSKILAIAKLEAHKKAGDDMKVLRTVSLLGTLATTVELIDDKQTLFGITITRNLRNTWIATVAALCFSSLLESLKPMMEHFDINDVESTIKHFPNDLITKYLNKKEE